MTIREGMKQLTSVSSGSIDPTIITRIETLEDYDETYEIFTNITSGTTSTITKPIGSTIVLDRYPEAGDAIIVTTDTNGRPIDTPARTAAGEIITTTFDTAGNYTLSGTPSAYPVSLIYQVTISRANAGNITQSSIVDKFETYEADEIAVDSSGFSGNLSTTDIEVQTALNTVDGLTIPIASDIAYNSVTWDSNTDVPTKNAVRDKFVTSDTAIGLNTTHRGLTTNPHSVTMDQLPISVIGTPTYDNLADAFNMFGSAGLVSGGVITDAGGATINVSAGSGLVRSSDDCLAQIYSFDFSAIVGTAIPTDTVRYIGVEYNAGSPQILISATNNFDEHTIFALGTVVNESGVLHILNNPQKFTDSTTSIIHRFYETDRFKYAERLGGGYLAETGTRNLTLTAVEFYDRLNEFEITSKNTSTGDTFDSYSSSGLESTGNTQWDNLNYDNAGTLTAMAANRYANLWFYVEMDDSIVCVYGTGQYTSSAAAQQESAPATLPARLTSHGKLLARLTFKQADTTALAIESAFDVSFNGTLASVHNNLSGLQGGITDEYYHLSASDYTAISGWSESNVVYVGKHGNDSNDGLTIANAKLTFANAITYVNTQTPSSSNRFSILCNDAGEYTESFTVPSWVGIIAPAAKIVGNQTVNENSLLNSFRLVASSGYAVNKTTGSGAATVVCPRAVLTSTAGALTCTSGVVNYSGNSIEVVDGVAINGVNGTVNAKVEYIDITGTGTGLVSASGGNLFFNGTSISCSGAGTALSLNLTCTITAMVNSISCNVAYNVIDAFSTLKLNCAELSGTQTGIGTVNYFSVDSGAILDGSIRILDLNTANGLVQTDADGVLSTTLTPSGLTSISATTGTFTNVGGTLSTAAQSNVTSLGTLTGLGVNGTTSLDGSVTINESGSDVDFRVESDTNENALFVEGSSGNVGIGVDTPYQGVLHVRSSIATQPRGITTEQYTDDSKAPMINLVKNRPTGQTAVNNDYLGTCRYMFYNDAATPELINGCGMVGQVIDITDGSEDCSLAFWTQVNGTYTNVLNLADGNIGIGVDIPTEILHIQEDTAKVLIDSSGDSTNGSAQIELSNDDGKRARYSVTRSGLAGRVSRAEFQADNELAIYTGGVNSFTAIFDNDGKLGIGTQNPLYPLSIARNGQSAQFTAQCYSSSTSDSPTLYFMKSSSSTLDVVSETIDSDRLGVINWYGADNTDAFDVGAQLSVIQNGASGSKIPCDMIFKTTSSGLLERLRITSGGSLSTGAETTPDVGQGGICLNQGGSDLNIFSLKSSDVAHGITTWEETDTYYSMSKQSNAAGGVFMRGLTESDVAFYMQGFSTTPSTVTSSAATACLSFDGVKKSGTSYAALGSTENIAVFNTVGSAKVIFKGNGNVEADGTVTSNSFDFAEYFESTDKTSIPNGTPVVLEADKIRAAIEGEVPFGVISATACFIGNQGLGWQQRYLTDNFGANIMEDIEWVKWEEEVCTVEAVEESEDTEAKDAVYKMTTQRWKIKDLEEGFVIPDNAEYYITQDTKMNPDYDPQAEFVSRKDRPEWNVVGLLGQVYIKKGSPVHPNWIKLKEANEEADLYLIK